MGFTLLPAVDVSDGRAVRLVRGEASTATAHGAPLEAALAWQSDGAEWIHLVDLDAAFGRGSNLDELARVIDQLEIDVQLSGGICDEGSLARALATGCSRANVATAALDDVAWCCRAIAEHGERIAVSLDVRIITAADGTAHHRLAGRGSDRESGDLWNAIDALDQVGCAGYVVTDVGRDGMLRGPNHELYRAVTAATETPVIASGGIASISDLAQLAAPRPSDHRSLAGAVVGTALDEGRFTLVEALDAVRLPHPPS